MALIGKYTAESGIPFNVVLLHKGDRYGLDKCLVHDKDETLIEFYDARQDPVEFGPEGQFTGGRYYLKTLLAQGDWNGGYVIGRDIGLNLHGGVPDWSIDQATMAKIMIDILTYELYGRVTQR